MSTYQQLSPVLSSGYFESHSVQDLSQGISNQPRWYAVFTLTRHEKRVHAQCEERRIESFLPTYQVKHRWKNRRNVQVELPLFPSYSFVRIEPQTRIPVLQLPGVIAIVSSGRHMLPIPDEYINSLREGLLVHRIEPHPELAIGSRVRISMGPMAGAVGILERNKSNPRVVLRLEMLARSVAVEVGASEIEPCETRTSPTEFFPGTSTNGRNLW
jgi:transcription antitermination factor NusG